LGGLCVFSWYYFHKRKMFDIAKEKLEKACICKNLRTAHRFSTASAKLVNRFSTVEEKNVHQYSIRRY